MNQKNPLLQLLHHTGLAKSRILFASLCSALNKICDILPEILIAISIDIIENQQNSLIARLGIINPFHQLYLVGFLTIVLSILESMFEYFYSIAWQGIAQDIQRLLRLKTYDTVQRLDLEYFANQTSGELLNTLYDDINQLEQFLSQGPNEIIQLIVNTLVIGLLFFSLSPLLALLTLIPIPFIIGMAYYFQHKLGVLYRESRQTATAIASHLAYRLQGIATIKSYTTEEYELNQLKKESALHQRARAQAIETYAIYIPIVRTAILVGFIMSLVIGGVYALQGTIPLTWYAALVFLTQRFLWPFASLTTITDMYEKTVACAKRILPILDSSPAIKSGPLTLDASSIKGAINFQNVSFSYAQGTRVLHQVSFQIPARKTVAFVGPTGSGKSTIILLLLRFYDVKSGTIALDGHDIKELTLDSLRNAMAIVSQDIYLVEGTIADNISYGTFNASRDAIIEAAKMAQAHDFIMKLPSGYDTPIQERGKNFSGGQRQRISIARAIVKGSPILIFDEATSAIDNETESAIQESIAQLALTHTIIIIAHRLSTVRNADTIFVLDKGSIIESGNHEELLKKDAAYAYLWNIQSK